MKTFPARPSYLLMVMLASLFYASCSDPEEEIGTTTQQQQQQQKQEQEEITQANIERFLESLRFTTSSKVIGTAPTVTNTSIIKMDSKDTIYTMPGQKIPVRISHPDAVALQGVYIASKNSTFYLDVPLDEEEDSDTVSVIIIEFPEDENVPNDVPLEIIPYDQSKNPVDMVERIITIGEPKNCSYDFLKDGDTTSIDLRNGNGTIPLFLITTGILNLSMPQDGYLLQRRNRQDAVKMLLLVQFLKKILLRIR